MTEYSYVWGGIATGDASSAPYSDDDWALIWSFLLQYDRTIEGPLNTNRAGFTGGLLVSNSSGTTIRVATGAAIVDGRLYRNNANIDTDVNGGGTGYYNVVLQKLEAAQTVRVAFLGPEVGIPSVTQNATTWEISIGTFHFDDGTDTVSALTDTRMLIQPLSRFARQGGSPTGWGTGGTNDYWPGSFKIQAGSISWTGSAAADGSIAVTFPTPFANTSIGIAVSARNSTANILVGTASGDTTLTIWWRDETGASHTSLTFDWMAIGPP